MSTVHRARALAPILDLAVSKVVEPGDTLIVSVYGHELRHTISKKGIVDRVLVLQSGDLIPLYEGEDE